MEHVRRDVAELVRDGSACARMRPMRPRRAGLIASVRWIGVLSAISFGVGCGGLDEFEQVLEDEASIPGSFFQPAAFALGYKGGFDGIQLSKADSFQNAGVEPSDVDAIFVKSVHLEGTKPQIDRLDVILTSVELFVEAPGVPRATIATITQFPPGASAVDLDADTALNLKPYAVAPSMSVGANVTLRQAPALETTLKTTVKLLVDINLLGF